MSVEKLEAYADIKVIEDLSSVPEHIRNQLEEGDMLIKAQTLTTDFLPEPWLKTLAKDSLNNRVLWRHKDPESVEKGHVYGRTLSAEVKANKKGKLGIESYERLFKGISPDCPQEKLKKWVKLKYEKGEDVGISKGFIVYRDKNGNIYRVFALEDSITHIPACKDCITNEVFQMEDEKKILESKDKEIEALQSELDQAKLQLEEKGKEFNNLKVKLEELEAIVETKETEKLSLEDRVIALKDEMKKLEVHWEEKLESIKKEPYLVKLEKLEDPEIFDLIKSKDAKWLKERLEKKEKETNGGQVITKSLSEEKKELEGEEDKVKNVGIEAFRNNPNLQALIKEMETKGTEWY